MSPMTVGILLIAAVLVLAALLTLWKRPASADAGQGQALLQLQQQMNDLARQVQETAREITSRTDTQLQTGTKALTDLVLSTQSTVSRQVADQTQAVGSLQQRLTEVGVEIRHLAEMGQDLRRLQDILKAPKVRGGFGERLLESLLGNLLPASNFSVQHPFTGGVVVDAVIRLPGGLVPVDAKFPLENFQRLLAAQGEEENRRSRKAFRDDVRRHAESIAAKYIRPAEGTLDMALMYVPAENVYYEAFVLGAESEGGPDLWDEMMTLRVFPVSPNSFAFYLTTLDLGLRGMRVAQEARRIVSALAALGGDLEALRESYDLTSRHLTNALRNFEDSSAKLERFSGKLRQIETEE